MLYKVKELVFGLNEFEKTKIELRFEMIKASLTNIKLQELRDFETLEEIIYKIKDQLRIKSSNLNKVIQNPSKKLRKKDVLTILELLNQIKYNFLKQAFTFIGKTPNSSNIGTKTTSNQNQIKKLKTDQEPQKQTTFEEEKTQIEDSESIKEDESEPEEKVTQTPKSSQIIKTKQYTITLENKTIPYMLISFNNDVNYTLLKALGTIFFDSYEMHGTNIIIEKNIALIIPRLMDDNLINLPQNQRNVEKEFEKIIQTAEKLKESNKNIENEKNNDNQEKKEETNPQIPKEAQYIELDKKPEFKKSSKSDDISLDELLSGQKNDLTPKPDPKKDKSEFTFQKTDPIEIEKQEIKKEPKEENRIEIVKNQQTPEKERTKNKENNNQSTNKKTIDLNNINSKFILYQDDKIIAYLNENSKVSGEIIILPISGENIKQINESDLSYMMIFSKIFSSILFEILEAHGTNLLFDYENNSMRIIVRFQNDSLPLTWTPKEESDSFLEDLRRKLLEKMHNALNNENNKENNDQTTKPKKKTKLSHKKAKHILDSIKRIP